MTRRFVALAAILLFTACGSGDRPEQADSTSIDADAAMADTAAVEELPPMPEPPDQEAGRLVVRAVGALELSRSWPARAGRCAHPSMVLLIAEEPGSGVSVMLELPPGGGFTGDYPVQLADSGGTVPAPASQLGIQLFEGNTAEAYQASAGLVTVDELTDQRMSGHLAVTFRHLTSNRLAQVAGRFHRVDVEALPLDWCAQAAAARDSLAAAADTAARDSAAGG
jgi:hypothetical protein